MSKLSKLNVLISGGGIAGPVAAFWLTKAGARVTIVERSSTPRKNGQSLDIRDQAVTVMRKMGLEDTIRANGTHEKGFQKLNSKGKAIAQVDATNNPNAQTITSEFEILRADLARVFTETVEDKTEIVYGEYVESIQQQPSGNRVDVTFANGRKQESYDLVIGADGMNSSIRELVRGKPARDDLFKLGAYCAYFRMPSGGSDSKTHARYFNATGGRVVWTRPTQTGDTSTYLLLIKAPDDRFAQVATAGMDAQKALMHDHFADAGYETDRILKEMDKTDDFYYQEIAQVRIDKFHYGRVALLGDAGYCPSPLSGGGTGLAMYGAYVLAGELTKQPDNVEAALESYEKVIRKVVEPTQKVPMWIFTTLNPQSQFAINRINNLAAMVSALLKLASWLKLTKLVEYISVGGQEDLAVPAYDWGEEEKTQ
ncbi:MAG: hypothetical protein Q9162_004593 [Coniocarpon cinnabarinum]